MWPFCEQCIVSWRHSPIMFKCLQLPPNWVFKNMISDKYKTTHWRDFIGTPSVAWSLNQKAGCFLCLSGWEMQRLWVPILMLYSRPHCHHWSWSSLKEDIRYSLRHFRNRVWLWQGMKMNSFCSYGRIFVWKIKVLLKRFRSYREIAQLMVTFASIAQPMVLLLLTLFFVSHMTVCVFLSVGETV